MAEQKKGKSGGGGGGPQGGGADVVVLSKCIAPGCSKKTERMNFCMEHYDWFKFGLLTKTGEKPTDFDKKYQAFLKNRKTKKAS